MPVSAGELEGPLQRALDALRTGDLRTTRDELGAAVQLVDAAIEGGES